MTSTTLDKLRLPRALHSIGVVLRKAYWDAVNSGAAQIELTVKIRVGSNSRTFAETIALREDEGADLQAV
jgi:hypothetical protein